VAGPADEFIKQYETCIAFNSSFNFYFRWPMPRKECQEFVDRNNECKGGHWEVRRLVEYKDHFDLLNSREVTYAGDGSNLPYWPYP